jgi:hypothetical protein
MERWLTYLETKVFPGGCFVNSRREDRPRNAIRPVTTRRRLSLGALNATPSTSVAASMMPYRLTSAMWSWTSRWRGLGFRPNEDVVV